MLGLNWGLEMQRLNSSYCRIEHSRNLGLIASAMLVVLIVFDSCSALRHDRSAEKRIAAVEIGLDPPVVIAGEPTEKWTIAMQMRRLHVPAVSVAVINDYKIDWARAWGVTEAGGDRPATSDTLFQAGSVSKPVASMAAMRLAQDGRLNLDANVNDYLKTWKVPDTAFTHSKPVTMRELLTNSSGTPQFGSPEYDIHARIPTLVEILDGIPPAYTPAVRVEAIPGSRWQYSNGGFEIAQRVVMDVTGEAFPEFMRTTLLEPLGMTRSTFDQPLPASMQTDAARGTLADGAEIPGGWLLHPGMMAAGLWTTPSDLARFAIALMNAKRGGNNSVISAPTGALILTSQITQSDGLGQGFGVSLSGDADLAGFSKDGYNTGFTAIMICYFSGRGIVVMTNSENGMSLALEIIRAVERVYGWDSYPKEMM
jgi:CubicO group peptidase (beta-lactamase class C family)